MSLILAVTNGNEIVIGADSLAYEGSSEIYRAYEIPKLRLVNNGSWVVAFTGMGQAARTVWDYLDAKGQTFNSDIRVGVLECIKCMGEILHRIPFEP